MPFVTHSFPWAWLTGNSSLKTLRELASRAGAQVLPGVVLSGASSPKTAKYEEAANRICAQVK
jgi:hypothetical protein